MKNFIFVLIIIFLCTELNAQTSLTFRNTSLDVITNMASIALGESFVANNNNEASFFENPAALPVDKGTRIFFDYRSNGWSALTDNMKFYSIGITTGNSYGNFGFSYNQYTSGDITASPEPDKQSTNDNNRTFILSCSNNVVNNLIVGVGLKMFNRSLTSQGFDFTVTSNNALLVDLGMLYSMHGILNSEMSRDNMNFALAIQNFGTDFTIEATRFTTQTDKVRLPRYLRIGFDYTLNTVIGKHSGTNLDLSLTGEYKNLLNPTEQERDDVDYWGAGLEATLFKILSLRIGGISSPEYNILYDRAKFNLRYGIGMNFPLNALGLSYPLFIKFDYASIPINHLDFEGSKNSLYAFGVSLIYNPRSN